MALVMGLDFGTGSVRVGLFDLETRAVVCEREAPYATMFPRLGWAEQSPLDWWTALGTASRAVMQAFGPAKIEAIAVATTASTVVACARDGRPLRPALLWMDCRAAEEAERTGESRHAVMAYSGGSDAAEWLVPKAMWMAKHDRSWADTPIVCECIDFINFKLTGRWAASRLNATCKWNYDAIGKRLPAELYGEFGVPGLEEKLPATVIPVGGTRRAAVPPGSRSSRPRPLPGRGPGRHRRPYRGARRRHRAAGRSPDDLRHLRGVPVPHGPGEAGPGVLGAVSRTRSSMVSGWSKAGRSRPARSCPG